MISNTKFHFGKAKPNSGIPMRAKQLPPMSSSRRKPRKGRRPIPAPTVTLPPLGVQFMDEIVHD